jgi:hypothetical protein
MRNARFALGAINRVVSGTVENHMRAVLEARAIDRGPVRHRQIVMGQPDAIGQQPHELRSELAPRAEHQRFHRLEGTNNSKPGIRVALN